MTNPDGTWAWLVLPEGDKRRVTEMLRKLRNDTSELRLRVSVDDPNLNANLTAYIRALDAALSYLEAAESKNPVH
jgi:hypothetical protein